MSTLIARFATLSLALSLTAAQAAEPLKCLPPPDLDDLQGEEGILYSSGLTSSQVALTMDDASFQAAACVEPGASVQGDVEVSLRVDCTGRVVSVEAERVRSLRPEVVECVLEVFEKTPFPAHDVRGGFDFGYVMTLDF
jgi:hypothetical protein